MHESPGGPWYPGQEGLCQHWAQQGLDTGRRRALVPGATCALATVDAGGSELAAKPDGTANNKGYYEE